MSFLQVLTGRRMARGLSKFAAIVIAAVVVLLFSSTIMWLLHFAVETLWLVLKIGVLVLLILIIAGWIQKAKKV